MKMMHGTNMDIFYSRCLKELSALFKERFAQLRKIEALVMFHVNPIDTLDVSFVAKL
jgi:hypothetical protein